MRSNQFFLLFALLSFSASCVHAQEARLLAVELEKTWEQDHRWQELNELDGRFRLSTPDILSHNIDSVETAVGLQAYHTFHLQAPSVENAENVIYALSYVDFPAGSLHHDSLELVSEFLLNTEEEATAAVGGEVIYAAEKIVTGYPARQWRIDYPSRGSLASARTLAVVAGNRYYELKVFSRANKGLNKSADKFFDSLRLFAPPKEQ